jgi:hypothetical protein
MMPIYILLVCVILWVAIYAMIVGEWKTVSLMLLLAVATIFLAGSKKT